MFKVAIIGGENSENYQFFQTKCINILREKAKNRERIIIYTLGDDYVVEFSKKFGIETVTMSCNWAGDGKNAFKNTTESILKEVDAVIVFDDEKSNVKYFLEQTKIKNLPTRHIILS